MEILIKLDLYEQMFEKDHLFSTQQFYHELSTKIAENFEIQPYLQKLDFTFKLENNIIDQFLQK